MFLPKNTLAITPLDNYINRQKSFSTPAIQWLEYISATHKLPVQHALKEGEAGFGLYFVGQTRKAFEFLGCFYHSCEKCFASSASHPLNPYITFGDVRHKSLEKKLVVDREKYPDITSQLITLHNQNTRDKRGFHLRNQTHIKRFRVVYDKRVLFSDLTTLPYGY
ncbi:uncharacterized protein LOC125146163 [Tachysurus ichikawai]